MDITPPGDQISRLLHVVVIEICQRIVSYTDELVVSGMVLVKADGVQVCRVPFEDAIKGKDRAVSSDDPQTEKSLSCEGEDNQKPYLLVSSNFDGDCVTPAGFSEDKNPSEHHGVGSNGSPNVNPLSAVKSAGKATGCFVEGSVEGCGTYTQILKRKELGLRNGTMVNGSRTSSVSNLGEMVMEYWQHITPELLKASALLCKLGELQKAIDAQSVSLADRNISAKKPNEGVNRSKLFRDFDLGADCMPTRSNFLQTLGSDFRIRNQCRLCQKVFTFATNLRRHQRNFHGRPLSRDTRRSNGSKSAFGGARSFADLSRLGSRRTNSVVLGEHSGHSLPRTVDSLVTEHSAKILDQELETNCATGADQQASTSHSNADQNLEIETGSASVALVVCPDEELEVCDVRPAEETNLGPDSVNCALSVSVDASRKNGSREKPKAFDAVEVVGADHARAECYAFDDCSCWDKSGDSMLDPISVDVSDDNSVHYFEECCSLDGSSGPATSGCAVDILTTDNSIFHRTPITDAITVGSPDSARSVEVQESQMKKFKCLLCDASFSMSNNLQRHVKKIHGTPKDNDRLRKAPAFESALDVLNCGSAGELKTRSSRYRHICVVCAAAFTFRTNLTRHMKKIHHQIPLDVSPAQPKDGSSPKP